MSGFFRVLPAVLELEGGYVNDPDDRGGATNHGITQGTYDAWNVSKDKPKVPVKGITKDEVQAIYFARYWVAGKCDALPWPLSGHHFDACVNHGLGRAAKMLQQALGVAADGAIGPITLGAVASADPDELLEELRWVRVGFYLRIAKGKQIKFLRGWIRRVIHLRESVR